MRKTELDIEREDIAHRLNGRLIGTGIHVSAGGEEGPYVVSVVRLSREALDSVLAALLVAVRRTMRPDPEEPDHAR